MFISLYVGDGKERPHMGESILFQDALMQGLGVGGGLVMSLERLENCFEHQLFLTCKEKLEKLYMCCAFSLLRSIVCV